MVKALGRVKQSEINGVVDHLMRLQAGKGPTRKQLKDISDFFKSVLHQCQFFYTLEVDDPNGRVPDMFGPQRKLLVGAAALQQHFFTIEKLFQDGGAVAVEMDQLQPFKQYGSQGNR